MITLQAWAYEHIIIACPHGISISSFVDNAQYPAGTLRWREDFYIHPTKGIHKYIHFYHGVVSQLFLSHVKFHPYHQYPVWDELEEELICICQVRILSGCWMNFLDYFQFEHVRYQFGLVQDVPLDLMRNQRESTLLVDVLEPLVYIKPDPMRDEDIYEEVDAYVIGVTYFYFLLKG